MNRKWLVIFTCGVLVLGLTPVFLTGGRAQSPAQSPSSGAAQAEWHAGDSVEPFTIPLGPDAVPGIPFPDDALPFMEPFSGDAVFVYGPGAEMDFTVEGPEFSAGVFFAGPDPQGGPPEQVLPNGGPVTFERSVAFVGTEAQDTITFVGFEAGLGNQVLAGAPYSAQVTSEFLQTLGDGNKIERKNTTMVYRDGQGRTRREQSLPAIGSYSASSETPRAIFINDPVAGVGYVLDPVRKVARKTARPNMRPMPRLGRAEPPAGGLPQGNRPRPNAGRRDASVTTESLGTRNMEGILVEGTRVTRTIPAGTVGNQQPIQITSERWFSPELRLNLLVKNTDPMRGQNSTTLTSIRRDEPEASLFQVPADYTVQEVPARMRGTRMPPRAPQQ
jgi:hypothetical protein